MIKREYNNQSVLKNRLKELRSLHNLSQEELADMVDVRRETIVHLENNKYNPSLKLAWSIARVFQLKIEEVMWYE